MGMQDARGRAKRERHFYARGDVRACEVCGRLFTKRADRVCSIACAEKKARAEETPTGTPAASS